MPQGAVKKKSTDKSKLHSSNRPLGPKKGKTINAVVVYVDD